MLGSEGTIRPAKCEDYLEIREFLLESSLSYPGIGAWWDGKVLPTLDQGKRIVFVVDVRNSIEGIFIGKPGNSIKVCTLRLHETVRGQGIGKSLLLKGLGCLLSGNTSSAKVTISEVAEEGCISFFESVGFHRMETVRNCYRKGLDEFIYSCSRSNIVKLLKDSEEG